MTTESDTPRFNVLVVEDSAPMRNMLVFALSRITDVSVTEADDGLDALRKIAGRRFDLVLTDLNMPILDGYKLLKRLRSDQAYKDVPILIITTEGAEEERQKAMDLGANAYLTKPIQPTQVMAMVREILQIDDPAA